MDSSMNAKSVNVRSDFCFSSSSATALSLNCSNSLESEDGGRLVATSDAMNFSRAFLGARRALVSNQAVDLSLQAVRTMANPRTSPTNSSVETFCSPAASSNSRAIEKETETDKSLEMLDSVKELAPPTPPGAFDIVPIKACMPPPVMLPRPKRCTYRPNVEAIRNATTFTSGRECSAGAAEGFVALDALFSYQHNQGFEKLRISRLFLEGQKLAPGNAGDKKVPKRKVGPDTPVRTVGPSVYGTTLANIVLHLSGRGVAAESAKLVRSVRYYLAEAADALTCIDGTDQEYMRATVASARVVKAQQKEIRSLNNKLVNIDSRLGYKTTAIGATIAIIVCFFILAERSDDMLVLQKHQAFIKTLECMHEALSDWQYASSCPSMAQLKARNAEKRICERAIAGALRASHVSVDRSLPPHACMKLQLNWARAMAYPYNETVSEGTHIRILQGTCTRLLDFLSPLDDPRMHPVQVRAGVQALVPLSAIQGNTLTSSSTAGSDAGSSDESDSTVASSLGMSEA